MKPASDSQDHPQMSAETGESSPKPSLLRLAWYFFQIALTTVQGAAGHMRRAVVQQRKLVTEKEFL